MKISLNKKKLTDIAFIVPSLAGVSIFVLIPFIDVLRRSFTNVSGTQFVFFSNYITIFQNAAFRLAFSNTIKFMVICIPILMIFSLLIAVFLNAGIRGANYLKTAYLVPMAIPVASVVLIWRLLFHQNGYFSGLLHMFGMQSQNWMDTGFAFWILVFSYVWKNLGYNVVLWMAGLTAIPDTLYDPFILRQQQRPFIYTNGAALHLYRHAQGLVFIANNHAVFPFSVAETRLSSASAPQSTWLSTLIHNFIHSLHRLQDTSGHFFHIIHRFSTVCWS